MTWEVTLFYWTGYLAIMLFLLASVIISVKSLLWMVYNKSQSAFMANAALLRAYIEYAYKYRFNDVDPENMSRFVVDGYKVTVEEVEE